MPRYLHAYRGEPLSIGAVTFADPETDIEAGLIGQPRIAALRAFRDGHPIPNGLIAVADRYNRHKGRTLTPADVRWEGLRPEYPMTFTAGDAE